MDMSIEIPTLLMWGVGDGAVPYPTGDSLCNLVKDPEADKYKYQFEECAHTPHF